MIVDTGTVRYLTGKIFQDFGKQFLMDAKHDFQIMSDEQVYRLGSGSYEPRKNRRTKSEALDQYFCVLNGMINCARSKARIGV